MTPDKPLFEMGERELFEWIETLKDAMRPRWIQVADAVLRGSSGRKAYWDAYYAPEYGPDPLPEHVDKCDANCVRVISSERVKAYMQACRHRDAIAEDVTLSSIVRRQLDIADRARAAGDLSAERQSMAEVTKLLDLYPTERRELLLQGSGLADLTEQEWAAILRAEQEATGATQH